MPKAHQIDKTLVDCDLLATLIGISRNVVSTLELNRILQETVDGAARLLGSGSAAMYLLEDATTVRLYATAPPLPEIFPEHFRVAKLADYPHMARAVQSSSPLYLPDVGEVTLSPLEENVVRQRNLRTMLFVPLILKNFALGAFIVGSTGQCITISEQLMDLYNTLANFAALSINNARLFEQQQISITELEATIAALDSEKLERQKLENELLHVQKLDAIGQLAGGVAHDFNNQLGGILGYAELLHHKLEEGRMKSYAEKIITLAQRSAELNTKLLAFSRKGQRRTEDVDIHPIVDEVTSILSHTISKKITIGQELGSPKSKTIGDPTQIQNALLNLGLNARDAMEQGGTLTYKTSLIQLAAEHNEVGPFELGSGDYVRVSVTDTGCGMNAETMHHMFEPFFTTKEQGKGTGMGLAAVFGTMKMHGGAIEVSSVEGAGTTFHLYFPAQIEPRTTHRIEETAPKALQRRHEVLIIDDEGPVCEVLEAQLKGAGYVAHFYTNPEKALQFFRDSHNRISLIMLDMVMPQMSGAEAFRAIKEIAPDVRVVLISGYAQDGNIQALLNEGADAFIHKPFRAAAMLKVVKEALAK
ncbi:MAG: response regulator [Deltaproteobacteria bacterium]|nr:response regulator [Deltaproteobacteria bacterium]